jgi:chromosome segregation ATPase
MTTNMRGKDNDVGGLIDLIGKVSEQISSAKTDVAAIHSALDVLRVELVGRINNLDEKIEEVKRNYAKLEERVRDLETSGARSNSLDTEKRIRDLENSHSAMSARVAIYAAIAGSLMAIVTAVVSRGLGLR